jgi:hypothetical protein
VISVELPRALRISIRAALVGVVVSMFVPGSLLAQTISEIHYHPPLGSESLEYVEIANELPTPIDISGYAFVEGIRYEFPAATILGPGEHFCVAADAEAVRARYGIEKVFGNFEGRLDGSGERIALANHVGIVVASVRYQIGGKWPVAPDGAGPSLVLLDLHSDGNEPESWAASPEIGGSPGRVNFQPDDEPLFEETTLVPVGANWRYKKGNADFSDPIDAWLLPEFDDASWETGPSGFGYADNDDATVLDDMLDGYTTVAIRTRFMLTEEVLASGAELFLGMRYDDGFCAWLNGTRIGGANCPTPALRTETATRANETGPEEIFGIDRGAIRVGENVITILGFNRSLSNNDFSLIPRVLTRRPLETADPSAFPLVFNELSRGDAENPAWIELHNPTELPFDLGGLALTENPDRSAPWIFPKPTVVPPQGFLVVSALDTTLVLDTPIVQLYVVGPEGHVLESSRFDEVPPETSTFTEYSELRFPDGGPEGFLSGTPTPGAPNRVELESRVVISEIFYHPPQGRDGEFLELYNRGPETVDLSGFRFTRGIDFAFPQGTTLASGAYIVLSSTPDVVRERYGLATVLGPWEGGLANDGENLRLVDHNGNIADEVRWYDGGEWPSWPDGGGSSLELIDPRSENDSASAWTDSDESPKSAWQEFSTTLDYVPAGESELHFLLPDQGVCRLDDISVVAVDDAEANNLVPNPDFERDTRPWRIEGTHGRSLRITEDRHGGEASLELRASGKGDAACNRIEIDLSPRLLRDTYKVSFWARWVRGTDLIITHGQFATGPWFGTRDNNMSGNTLGARFRMTIPEALGSPGAENGSTRRLREATGSVNLGPTIDTVSHAPAIPRPDESVRISARVLDADGVSKVRLSYTVVRTTETIDMVDDGSLGDAKAGDGVWIARIPAQAQRARVSFWIDAEDSTGRVASYPRAAPTRKCTYVVDVVTNEVVQVVLDDANLTSLDRRPVLSNELVDGTFIYGQKNVYYNVGVRYRGSPWGRPSKQSYRIRFPEDKRFTRDRGAMNLSNRDRNDSLPYFIIGRSGNHDTPAPASDYTYVRARINSQALGQPGFFDPIDRVFVRKWYGDDAVDQAIVLKGVGRLRFSDACERTGWDEATLLHMDESSENYRFYYFHGVNQSEDRWEPYMALTKVLDPRHTQTAEFDLKVDTVLNVERFLRVLGPRVGMSDWDALYVGNGHNGTMIYDPIDGRWGHLAFDFGGAFSAQNAVLSGVRDASVRRLISRPAVQRVYYRIFHELLAGYWSAQRAGPFLDALQRAAGTGSQVKAFLTTSGAAIQRQIQRYVDAKFRITTNDGADFSVEDARVTLEGEAPVQIVSFLVERNGADPEPFTPDFSALRSPSGWRASFELPDTSNAFRFFGVDYEGNLSPTVSITISRGGVFRRGDPDGDGHVTISDAVATLRHLFSGEPVLCEDAGDIDDDGLLTIADPIRLLEFLFRGGEAPSAPFPGLGGDTTADDLGCNA